jgi:ABC-2 type transport system permease protein
VKREVWEIAGYHFRQETSRRSFLFVLLSMPLFLAFSVGLGLVIDRVERGNPVLGYVDPAGLLAAAGDLPPRDGVTLTAYEGRESAQAALEAGQIDAYYVLPAGINPLGPEPLDAELVYVEPPPGAAVDRFEEALRHGLLAGQAPGVAERVLDGPEVTVRSLEAGREFPTGGPEPGQLVSILAALLFTFLVLTTAGFMMGVIVSEKENRTMEVVVSSVSPGELMAGKVLGALGIAAVQLLVWLAFLVATVWVARHVFDMPWLADLDVDWGSLGLLLIVAVPAYFCTGASMTLLGTTLVDSQEAHQTGPLFFVPLLMPLWLVVPLAAQPNGPMALALSFFPVTAVMTFAIRTNFVVVPAWQAALSAAISLAGGMGLVWLTGRAFRLTMLRYGKRLRFGELFGGRAGSRRVT